MNKDENTVYEYLKSLGYTDIQYEPDGNTPPDFLLNSTIAIEVRRLNLQDKNLNDFVYIEDALQKNIQLYSDEKNSKVKPFRNRYKEWWLILVNHINYRDLSNELYDIKHSWDKLLIIKPN